MVLKLACCIDSYWWCSLLLLLIGGSKTGTRWWCTDCWNWVKQSSVTTSTSEMSATLHMANMMYVSSLSCSVY